MDAAEVYLWGTRIGAVAQDGIGDIPKFNYDKAFLGSGIEVSPIVMPLSERIYSFPALSKQTFHGLPGLLADSLPDKFGTKLIERYLAERGRSLQSLTAVERLLYTGKRGMGALEFFPQRNYIMAEDTSVDINALVELASMILADRENIHISAKEDVMEQIDAGEGYEYWLIKFDGVKNNKDKGDKEDGQAYTRIEYAYYLMAREAGIIMSDCQLYQESGHYHFMTKRFDRNDAGEKIHMQTLGALTHYDYNIPGAYSYEQTAHIIEKLEIGQKAVEQFFRRMVFNIIMRNQDDHVKNISFLMSKAGRWSLAPAYDITYASDEANYWLARHQMSMNGKTENFETDDFYKCGKAMNLSKAKVKRILEEVRTAALLWEQCAQKAFLRERDMEAVKVQFLRI